jgi:hypothetical protein
MTFHVFCNLCIFTPLWPIFYVAGEISVPPQPAVISMP